MQIAEFFGLGGPEWTPIDMVPASTVLVDGTLAGNDPVMRRTIDGVTEHRRMTEAELRDWLDGIAW